MRRSYLLLLALSVGSASCSMPEDSNPATRCAEDLSCPDALECYRGFCIEPDGPDEVTWGDAGSSLDVWPRDASARRPDASAHPGLPDAGLPPDAAEVIVHDAPSGPVTGVVTTPIDTTPPVATVPVIVAPPAPTTPAPTTPAPTTPAPTTPTVPCLAECAGLDLKADACKSCFKSAFGEAPEKVCVSPLVQAVPTMATLCASLCSNNKGAHGSGGCDSNKGSCTATACGGK
ncbi:MAG: hypothetical protein JWN48_2863 [Myxococcaceae bacterium]|nr:hypothetical protein [Myxococcaceae bacterium]